MNSKQLKSIIEHSMENAKVFIETQDNVHFKAIIISPKFAKIDQRVKQHQLIYSIINEYINSGEIHAISIKTYSPDEWEILQRTR